jgi:hypothetical protein
MAAGSATVLPAVFLKSMSTPPILSFSSRNSSTLIAPLFSAFSPYWTPTLSSGRLANPSGV